MSFLQQRIWEGTRRSDVRVINITDRIFKVRRNEHSRSQASQPFTFRLWLRMAGSVEPVSVIAPPDKRAQARLLEFLDRACAGRTTP